MKKVLIVSIIAILAIGGLILVGSKVDKEESTPKDDTVLCTQDAKLCPDGSYVGRTGPKCEFAACPEPKVSAIKMPIDRAAERITKKPFGKYVDANNSPVSPERFKGYHVAVDFETFEDEQDKDVEIFAICAGPLLVKKSADGYGGVMVQKCDIENQVVTVLYGHLRLSSIKQKIGQEIKSGESLGVLGTGYTAETDNERKHLHLSIHKGADPILTGYVQNQSSLSAWLDPQIILGI
jgi:hypothetical protein